MALDFSRRRVLATGGILVGSFLTGQPMRTEPDHAVPGDDEPSEWPMEQHDPGGTSYAPDAYGPKDSVLIRWKQQIETGLGFAYLPTPVVANVLVYGVGKTCRTLSPRKSSITSLLSAEAQLVDIPD